MSKGTPFEKSMIFINFSVISIENALNLKAKPLKTKENIVFVKEMQ